MKTETRRFEVRFGGVAHEVEATAHEEAALSVVRVELGADARIESAGRWDSTNVERWKTAGSRHRLVLTREI